jgi:hypothetical protein
MRRVGLEPQRLRLERRPRGAGDQTAQQPGAIRGDRAHSGDRDHPFQRIAMRNSLVHGRAFDEIHKIGTTMIATPKTCDRHIRPQSPLSSRSTAQTLAIVNQFTDRCSFQWHE